MDDSKSKHVLSGFESDTSRTDQRREYVDISVAVLPEHVASLNLWAALQSDNPDLSEAIRRIISEIELCSADTLHDKVQESRRKWRRIGK